MNPIFGKEPEKTISVARAIGALQGPKGQPDGRLKAFLELAEPSRADVLSVEKQEVEGRVRVTKVAVAVRYKVGHVRVALYFGVMPPRGSGITDTDPQHTQRLLASWTRAVIYIGNHPPLANEYKACRRCKRFLALLRSLGLYSLLVIDATPDPMCGKPRGGTHGFMLEVGVRLAIARNCPQFSREARRIACEVAWRTAKEKEMEENR